MNPLSRQKLPVNITRDGQKTLSDGSPGVIMGTTDIQHGQNERVLDYGQAGPTVARMLLGARLRKLRESAHLSREDAGDAIRGRSRRSAAWSWAGLRFKQRDVTDLLDLYQVTEDERATLLAIAGHANAPGWWQAYGDVVPDWFEPYLGLEQAADVIRTYEVQFIPGLLQTADYARAVLEIGTGSAPEAETEPRVSLRMRRQQILHRDSPPRLWACDRRGALRRPMCPADPTRHELPQEEPGDQHPAETVRGHIGQVGDWRVEALTEFVR